MTHYAGKPYRTAILAVAINALLLGSTQAATLHGSLAKFAEGGAAAKAATEAKSEKEKRLAEAGISGLPVQGIAKRTADRAKARATNLRAIGGGKGATSLIDGNGRIGIVAVATNDVNKAVADLERLGAVDIAVSDRLINARLPVKSVAGTVPLTSVASIALQSSKANIVNTGAVTSQGDAAIRANLARAGLGADGAGVKVCVVSDSFDVRKNSNDPPLTDAADDVLSGDLPGTGNPNGRTTPVQIFSEGSDGSSDEGRAMAQIIHDVAPGASLGFGGAFVGGKATFVQLLGSFATAGCNVVADDTNRFDSPFLGDGIVNKKIDELVNQGIHYYISAGNQASSGYVTPFRGGTTVALTSIEGLAIGSYELHNFNTNPNGPPKYFQGVSLSGAFQPLLQWNDKFLSEGTAGGAQTEVDAFVAYTANGVDSILFRSSGNDGSADAVEFAGEYQGQNAHFISAYEAANQGADPLEGFFTIVYDENYENVLDAFFGLPDFGQITLYFGFGKKAGAGAAPKHVRWVDRNKAAYGIEFGTLGNRSTVIAHSTASRAVAVAAARYDTIDLSNAGNPATAEWFTSRGGTTLYYDGNGAQLATPLVLRKPEVTGPDGADTTFFLGEAYDSTPAPNFFGTSASAPHVAAVGAVLLSATGKEPSPDTLRAFLQSTAKDMNDPDTSGADPGFDNLTGTGIVHAFDAAAAVTTSTASIYLPFAAGGLLGNGRALSIDAGSGIASVTLSGYGSATDGTRDEKARFELDPPTQTISGSQPDKSVFVKVAGKSRSGNTSGSNTQNAYITNLGFTRPSASDTLKANQAFTIATATNENVTKVDYTINGTSVGSSTNAATNFAVTATRTAGNYTLLATARNSAGTVLYTRSRSISVSP